MAYPQHMDSTEAKIITAILDAALGKGLSVSVFDGEEWSLKQSRDQDAISAEIHATDTTTLRFRNPMAEGDKIGTVFGSVTFIHGNHADVMHDWSDTDDMNALLAPAKALSETFL